MFQLSRICRPTLACALRRCKVNSHRVRAVQIEAGTPSGRNLLWASLIAGSLGTGVYLLYSQDSLSAKSRSNAKLSPPSLPIYSTEDVAKHNSLESGVWVTFEGVVYDITDFVNKHPGGDKILLAAGSAIEPFWAMYAVHQTDEVLKMLEEYRIGMLKVNKIIVFHSILFYSIP